MPDSGAESSTLRSAFQDSVSLRALPDPALKTEQKTIELTKHAAGDSTTPTRTPLKILIVGPSNRFQSGISTYTIRLANALHESGHQVSMIAFRKLLPRFLFPGARRVGAPLSTLRFHDAVEVFDGMDYDSPSSWKMAGAFLDRLKPDAVLLQWWTSAAAHMHLQVKRAAVRRNIPVYVELHEVVDPLEQRLFPISRYARFMGRRVIRGNAGYYTHSERDKQLVCEAYDLDPEVVSVIPHGTWDHFGPRRSRRDAREALQIQEPFVFLYFGLIREYKGVPLLVEAFERLPPEVRAQSRLLLVGEVWEQKWLLYQRLLESPCRDSITLVDDYVPDEQVSTYFSAADSVVLPYRRASQSGVAQIAVAYGSNVIATRVGGIPEALQNHPNSTLIEPDNVDALRTAMLAAYSGRSPPGSRISRMSSWSRVAEGMVERMLVPDHDPLQRNH